MRLPPGLVTAILFCLPLLLALFRSRRANHGLARLVEERDVQLRQDPLTGVGNRRQFHEELEGRLAHGDRDLSVVYLDLDDFKRVNEFNGQEAGDALLCIVAGCLAADASALDIVARYGGDEFVVLVAGALDRAERFAEQALIQIREASEVLMPCRTVSASIGICHAGHVNETDGPAMIVRRADAAHFAARAAGGNCIRVGPPHMSGEKLDVLAHDLPLALQGGEVQVFYQPILRVADHSARIMEALVRWTHPQFGTISPLHIVDCAERAGLTQALTLYVLRNSLRQQERLRRLGRDIQLCVNIMPSLFSKAGFGLAIVAVLHEFEAVRGRLFLEITEEEPLIEGPLLDENLRILSLAGVHIAIDDFGVAYSQISRFTVPDFRMLKLDKLMTENAATSERSSQIIENVCRLAAAFGAETVCEGVETEEQARAIEAAGAHYVQGFYYASPMPAAELELYLAAQDARLAQRRA